MRKLFHLLFPLLGFIYQSNGQVTTSPQFPKATDNITFTVDVTGTSLENYSNDVWIWTWIEEGCSASCDAPTNVNPATSAQSAALMTRDGSNTNVYNITFTPTSFFNKSVDEFIVLGLLLKGQDWSNGQTPDYKVEISTDQYAIQINQPTVFPLFFDSGDVIQIQTSASEASDLTIRINNVIVSEVLNNTTVSYSGPAGSEGKYLVEVIGDNGTESASKSFSYVVRSMVTEESRPAGIIDGINYGVDPGKVTLSLWAPLKSNVYVLGEFNDFQPDPDYFMKKDGEHFWLEIAGLTNQVEYVFQYLVDENIKIADPYADKILDPEDNFIPTTVYPGLKSYPSEAVDGKSYYNRLSVIQTGQIEYNWQINDFQKPAKENLIIYELLIRDFFGPDEHTYQNLIDTLSYFEKLGVNAIELMPVQEFNGNKSWGYNPTFMFAPDKYYGTKDKLKEFVDVAHEKGIAVILDITMNHQDIPNPYLMMYYDFTNYQATVDNPWFNQEATHPFNVFSDMNHESLYTQAYLDTITHYWINEFKVDGYRFDLSKGFTQVNSGTNVSLWSSRDDSRIALLKRMSDEIWSHSPEAYVILEHFADNTEEKELAEYGMMLWGNMNEAYVQSTMGYAENSNLSGIYHGNRNWNVPHLIGYMESHDEERMMYKNIAYGNSTADYNAKDLNIGLNRVKSAAAFFYLIPGPKMLWQYGEIGYDKSINLCDDGIEINNDCRISEKPVPWNNVEGLDYGSDNARNTLSSYISAFIKLRNDYPVFKTSDVTISDNALSKYIVLKNEMYTDNPPNTDQMNVVIVGNFDIEQKSIAVNFPHNGIWYSYLQGGLELSVENTTTSLIINPGVARIYTDVLLPRNELITSLENEISKQINLFPNPANDFVHFDFTEEVGFIKIIDINGRLEYQEKMMRGMQKIELSNLSSGIYLFQIHSKDEIQTFKLIKK